jgi:GT2 family glycosyltransferase
LIYVDGGSGPAVATFLRQRAREHDFALIRSDCMLTPNRARNLTLPYLRTQYVAFLDNDALVCDGWLGPLEACANETGAAIVSPLVCIGEPHDEVVHVAGGESHLVEHNGDRRFVETHPGQSKALGPMVATVSRSQCEQFEFHAVLMRTDALDEVGPLDEGLLSLFEHSDLGLRVRERGGTVWLEPAVPVTYLPTQQFRGDDRTFFIARWSDDWNRRSAHRFAEKWRLSAEDPKMRETTEFAAWMRLHAYRPYRSPFTKVLHRFGRAPRPLVDRVSQRVALRRFQTRTARSRTPFLAHRPQWLGVDVDA